MLINNSDLPFLRGRTHGMDQILLPDLTDSLQRGEHSSAPCAVRFSGLLEETAEERASLLADCSGPFRGLTPSNCPASSAAGFVAEEAASQETEVSLLQIRAGKPTRPIQEITETGGVQSRRGAQTPLIPRGKPMPMFCCLLRELPLYCANRSNQHAVSQRSWAVQDRGTPEQVMRAPPQRRAENKNIREPGFRRPELLLTQSRTPRSPARVMFT